METFSESESDIYSEEKTKKSLVLREISTMSQTELRFVYKFLIIFNNY